MSVYAGPTKTWINGIDTGKLHASTKLIVQTGLVMNLDPGTSTSYSGSGSTWTDLSGNARNMTLFNTPTYDTTVGGNILFNGTTQYGTASIPALTNYTLSFWVKFVNFSTGTERQIFNSAGPDTFGVSVVDTIGNGIWRWQSWNGSVGRQSTSTVTTGVWYNFVMTGTASTAEFFLNGSSINTYATGASIASGTGFFAAFSSNQRNFNCNMGPISFYNTVLSSTDILKNFNALRDRFGI